MELEAPVAGFGKQFLSKKRYNSKHVSYVNFNKLLVKADSLVSREIQVLKRTNEQLD